MLRSVVVEVLLAVACGDFGVGGVGRVSANSDATLKLLIRELDLGCGGIVGLMAVVLSGVTVIPRPADDFNMYLYRLLCNYMPRFRTDPQTNTHTRAV